MAGVYRSEGWVDMQAMFLPIVMKMAVGWGTIEPLAIAGTAPANSRLVRLFAFWEAVGGLATHWSALNRLSVELGRR